MHQLPLFKTATPTTRVVNVASVPQRSPFRYPGGKTWLVPHARLWLASLPFTPVHFIEPFAGGAIISLTVAAEKLAHHVTMVELDEQVAAVWATIFSDDGGGEWLARQIVEFELTPGSAQDILSRPEVDTRQRAFQTILRNRVYHGGILAPGASPVKYGENGKGIHSRWYPQTLRRRILALSAMRDRVTFVHGDGFEVLSRFAPYPDAVYFIDPPYTAGTKNAGSRLYTHYNVDHEHLFEMAASLKGPFLMTYDNDPAIVALAERHNFDTLPVAMKNTHHATMTELLIGRDLNWGP